MKLKLTHNLIVHPPIALNHDLSDFNWTEIVDCPTPMDLWEYGRVQSFCGYLTTTDFGGSKESLPEIEKLLEKGDAFVIATANIDPNADETLKKLDIGKDDPPLIATLIVEPLYEGHKDYNLPAEEHILGGAPHEQP